MGAKERRGEVADGLGRKEKGKGDMATLGTSVNEGGPA